MMPLRARPRIIGESMSLIDVLEDRRLVQLRQILALPREELAKITSPYLCEYFSDSWKTLSNPLQFKKYYSIYCYYIFNRLGCLGKTVMDLGCGYGLKAIHLALFGALEVIAVDVSKEKIKTFNRLLNILDPPLDNIKPSWGDASRLIFEDEICDIVYVSEVISHVRDEKSLLSESRRVLKKGGILFISDGNNSLNPYAYYHAYKIWERLEHHKGSMYKKLSFRKRREMMIKKKFPALNDKLISFLAKETQGMWGKQIFKAVRDYLKQGKISWKPSFKYRQPEDGMYPERQINPYKLAHRLREMGFKTKVVPYLGMFTRKYKFLGSYDRTSDRVRSPIEHIPYCAILSPMFHIIAEKVRG